MSTLAEIDTHDSQFTRGYWLGYAKAQIEIRAPFSMFVPTSQIPDIMALLTSKGADIDVGTPISRKYSVLWCHVDVRFP